MPDKEIPLVFDTVVLSNFAFAEGGISLLKQRYQMRGMVTLQVIQEITKAIYAGHPMLEHFDDQMFSKNGFRKISLSEKEHADYLILLRQLGEGEASCIAAAIHRKGIVVSDDRMARNTCREKDIPITGTIGILKAAYINDDIDLKTADDMLQQMIKHGFYSPISKISDVV